MRTNRDDFSQDTIQRAAKRVGYRCSCPECRVSTVGPSEESEKKVANIGEASHICAAAPGGPRYNSEMTPEERKSISNCIWLCRKHARLIDLDSKKYTVEVLRKWKKDAEEFASRELGVNIPLTVNLLRLEYVITALNKALKKEKDYNPSLNMMKIEKDIFPMCYMEQTIRVENIGNIYSKKSFSLTEAIELSWKAEKRLHISLYGIGGIGKTVSLLSLDLDVPMVYIAVNKLQGKSIFQYIRNNIFEEYGDDRYWDSFKKLQHQPYEGKPSIIIILDGLNEINESNRKSIYRELNNNWNLNEGVQLILSSRYDSSSELFGVGFLQLQLVELTKQQITEYLSKMGIKCPDMFDDIWDAIDTPLMLNLYAASEHMKKEMQIVDYINLREPINAGAIIWNYLQFVIYRYAREYESSVTPVIIALYIAPHIAYEMQKEGIFSLDVRKFSTIWISHAYDSYMNLNEKPIDINEVIMRSGDIADIHKTAIFTLLTKNICLFYLNRETNKVVWMHQHFRDALAAVFLYEMAQTKSIDGLQYWIKPMDQYVETFLEDLIKTEESSMTWFDIWELYRNSNLSKHGPAHIDFINRMLRIYRAVYGDDISDIDFSDIDLRGISLVGAQLDKKSKKHFVKTILEESTFLDKGHRMKISALSWSMHGDRYLSTSNDCSIRLWNSSNEYIDSYMDNPHTVYIRDAKWCPTNNHMFASAGDDQKVFIWNYENEMWKHRTIGTCESWINTLDWSPDGKTILCGDKLGNVTLFTLEGDKYSLCHNHTCSIKCVCFINNSLFVSGSDDGMVYVWSKCKKAPIMNYYFNSSVISIYSETHEKVLIVITKNAGYYIELDIDNHLWGEKKLIISNIIDAAAINTFNDTLYCAIFMPEAVGIYKGMWDKEKDYKISKFVLHKNGIKEIGKISCAEWNNNCSSMLIGLNSGAIWNAELVAREANHDRLILSRLQSSYNCSARCTCWSLDGKYLLSGHDDYKIRLWDVFEKRCVKVYEGHKDSVKCIVWDNQRPDVFYSGGNDGTILSWNINDSNYKKTIYSSDSPINCIIQLKDMRLIAGDDKGNLIVDDLEKAVSDIYAAHDSKIYSLIEVSNDYLISAGDDNKLYIWKILDKLQKVKIVDSGHKNGIRSIAYSEKTGGIFTGANDNTLHFIKIDFESGKYEFESEELPLHHTNFIYSIAIARNGLYVASGSTDTNVGFWDALNKTFLGLGTEHGGEYGGFIWNVSASPCINNKYYIASSSSDGLIKIWDVTHITYGQEIKSTITLEAIPGISIAGCDFSGAHINDKRLIYLLEMNGGNLK